MITQHDDGSWSVTADDGAVIATGLTHAEAWRLVDQYDDNTSYDEETYRRVMWLDGPFSFSLEGHTWLI